MKKKSTTTTRRKATTIHPGLQYAFKLIDIDGNPQNASKVYPHALKIIQNIHVDGIGGRFIEEELMAAARAMFPPVPHDPTSNPDASPEIAAVAGFYVGFAVNWLLMSRINGG